MHCQYISKLHMATEVVASHYFRYSSCFAMNEKSLTGFHPNIFARGRGQTIVLET